MKKVLVFLCAICLFFGLSAIAPLHAQEAIVEPLSLDFGSVEVWQSATLQITITAVHPTSSLILTQVNIDEDPAVVFEIPAFEPVILAAGGSKTVDVTYNPNATGPHSGTIKVVSNDHDDPWIFVELSGNGIDPGEPTPGELMEETIAFFDASVIYEFLVGSGPANSAEKRLNALMNMLLAAQGLIEAGDSEGACEQLMAALMKCDGMPLPPDLVTGEAAEELAGKILKVIDALYCT